MFESNYFTMFINKNEILQEIIDIGFDYDGYESTEELKKLIDELVELAKYGLHLEK